MKTTLQTLALLAIFAAVPVILTGCAKDGYEQAAVTKDSIVAFRASIGELNSQISVANNSLQTLVSDTTTDPTPRFKSFSEAVDKVISLDESARSKGEDVQANAKKTIEAREKVVAQIDDVNMRKTATTEKENYSKQFQTVKSTTASAVDSTKAYISKLLNIRDMLSADLSARGITEAKSYVGGITDLGKEATKNLDALSELVGKVAESTSHPVATPPTAATGSQTTTPAK
ncbi:MAG: hypothetical protein LBV12_12775 [Puniceicoccales bacterium]|jgi:prophage DNA circulation protein|nr:hypothetical protein [Puniceicoccales bacterium]